MAKRFNVQGFLIKCLEDNPNVTYEEALELYKGPKRRTPSRQQLHTAKNVFNKRNGTSPAKAKSKYDNKTKRGFIINQLTKSPNTKFEVIKGRWQKTKSSKSVSEMTSKDFYNAKTIINGKGKKSSPDPNQKKGPRAKGGKKSKAQPPVVSDKVRQRSLDVLEDELDSLYQKAEQIGESKIANAIKRARRQVSATAIESE